MKVVFIGEHPNRTKLFAGLAETLRQQKCASDRSGLWTPAAKAQKVAARWATVNNLNHKVTKELELTSFTVDLSR